MAFVLLTDIKELGLFVGSLSQGSDLLLNLKP